VAYPYSPSFAPRAVDDDGDRDLEVLIRIAYAVQGTVRRVRRSPRRAEVVGMGAFGSPTQEIDRVAEAQVLSSLEVEGVDWDLLSEEAGHVRRGGRRVLVLDPVDGSHNLLRGLPFATVSLALGSKDLGGIEVGVVQDLNLGVTYWAIRGKGAYRDGARIRPRSWDAREELFFLNLGRHASPRSVGWAGKGRRTRSLGCASYEMALVAEGSADAYFFENDTATRNLRVTDIAAATRILTEAGGVVTDADGRSIDRLPLSPDERTSVLAIGDPAFVGAARSEGYL
jgi:fructose-1,6-bisphosphatase/inositol monophosphatase family enzyme